MKCQLCNHGYFACTLSAVAGDTPESQVRKVSFHITYQKQEMHETEYLKTVMIDTTLEGSILH